MGPKCVLERRRESKGNNFFPLVGDLFTMGKKIVKQILLQNMCWFALKFLDIFSRWYILKNPGQVTRTSWKPTEASSVPWNLFSSCSRSLGEARVKGDGGSRFEGHGRLWEPSTALSRLPTQQRGPPRTSLCSYSWRILCTHQSRTHSAHLIWLPIRKHSD